MVKIDGLQGIGSIRPSDKYTPADVNRIVANGLRAAKETIAKGYPEALKTIES